MARNRTGRTTNDVARRRTTGGVSSIAVATSNRSVSTPPYVRDPRWATPARRRADVYVVDLDRPGATTSHASDDEPLLLTA
jgi:hypothetical protein